MLLDDLVRHTACRFTVMLTVNTPETLPFSPDGYPFRILVLRNARHRGFSANHNTAFRALASELFCVLNPDIRLTADPFPTLVEALRDPNVAAVAPRVTSATGEREDNARLFPTPWTIALKALGIERDLDWRNEPGTNDSPDWIAGMFMLFRSAEFGRVGGFDQRYFLYYEDVDICARLRLKGLSVKLCEHATAIHDARRDSHRKPRYFLWHFTSLLRFFLSAPFRRLMLRRWRGAWRHA